MRNAVQPSLFAVMLFTIARFILERFPFAIPKAILSQNAIRALVTWRRGDSVLPLPLKNTRGFVAYRLGTDVLLNPAVTVLYIHGGGFAFGSIALYTEPILALLGHIRRQSDMPAECVAVDYSLSPTARYPTSLLECLRAYAHLIEVEKLDPSSIVLCGDSAGGNLAMAMLLCLSGQCSDPQVAERDWSALPMPVRAVLISPWVDLRPEKAAAYVPLRTQNHQYSKYELHSDSSRVSKTRDPWLDYLSPEALVQYAQLYTNKLQVPRRVRGPASALVSYLDSILEHKVAPTITFKYIRHPWNYMCALVRNVLQQPLLPSLHKDESTRSSDFLSEAVASSCDLFLPISSESHESNPLVSPVLGDWGNVSLSGGICVVWGKNEELAGDIEAWVATLKTAWTGGDVAHAAVHGHDDVGRVVTIAESNAFGVHIWPLACFYVGRNSSEREYGLHLIARAITRIDALSSVVRPVIQPDSPTSMPSDYEETVEDIDGLLAWKRGILNMGVEAPPNFLYNETHAGPVCDTPPMLSAEMPLAEPPSDDENNNVTRRPSAADTVTDVASDLGFSEIQSQ